jgi:hypothetical protein
MACIAKRPRVSLRAIVKVAAGCPVSASAPGVVVVIA